MEIIGIGRTHNRVMDYLRMYNDSERILVYPEFFDAKKCLVNKNDLACLKSYVRNLWLYRDRIIIAVYPDYRGLLQLPGELHYVYPIHTPDCWDRLLKIETRYSIIPGYPRGLTYQGVQQFLETARDLGFDTWFMGLTPRYIGYMARFWGCDLTTYSIPGYNHEKIKQGGGAALLKLAKTLISIKIQQVVIRN